MVMSYRNFSRQEAAKNSRLSELGWSDYMVTHKSQLDESGITMPQRPPIVIIAGPTGVGKTSTAIALAGPLGGEIVGADAMQVYRHMDIGTAKPTDEECALVKHHLIDVVDPDESFSAAQYRILANTVIKDLYQSGVLAFVVGGTGLYIKALTKGLFEVDEMDAFIQKRLRLEVEFRSL
jgi:tRNA dimethylallyltransferase